MDTIIKLNSQVAGKDKVARLLQYSCRTLWDSLNQKNEAQVALISQLKNLEYILSSFRKRECSLSTICDFKVEVFGDFCVEGDQGKLIRELCLCDPAIFSDL